MSVTIEPFSPEWQRAVVELIVPIQRDEYGVATSAEAQPDLAIIPTYYQTGAGQFWVARDEGRVVGTISLKDMEDGQGALRKMFVAADRRGREHGIGSALLTTLIAHARAHGLQRILLGTTEAFVGAHRFYEKNGFVAVAKADLPASFPLMAVDTRFYALDL